MKATSTSLVFRPLVLGQPSRPSTRRRRLRVLGTSQRDADDRSRIVDENMIMLRKRIHELKMVEGSIEAPSHWMDWEKKYYVSYDTDVCEAVGMLQRFLMSTRPSLGLGMLVLVCLSVPTSLIVVFFNLIEVVKGIANVVVHR